MVWSTGEVIERIKGTDIGKSVPEINAEQKGDLNLGELGIALQAGIREALSFSPDKSAVLQ